MNPTIRPRSIFFVTALLALAAAAVTAAEPALPDPAAYEKYCLACHQANGSGVPNMQPPLVGSTWVKGDPEALAVYVLSGGMYSAERIDGASHNIMPGFMDLDDATVAAALSYIRAAFGEGASPVAAAIVSRARATVTRMDDERRSAQPAR